MEGDFCYYIVPSAIGIFGVVMTIFLRKIMSNGTAKLESELQKLTSDTGTKSKSKSSTLQYA